MPLTLDKLFSRTQPADLEIMGEPVHVEWAPARYTGEMDDYATELLAEQEAAEDAAANLEVEANELRAAGKDREAAAKSKAAARVRKERERRDRRHLRKIVAELVVSWDIMDGAKPLAITEETLRKLPPFVVEAVFLAISAENKPDPTKAPPSPDGSGPKASSEPSPTGTPSSEPLTTSESHPGTSSPEPEPSAITPSGGGGPS